MGFCDIFVGFGEEDCDGYEFCVGFLGFGGGVDCYFFGGVSCLGVLDYWEGVIGLVGCEVLVFVYVYCVGIW